MSSAQAVIKVISSWRQIGNVAYMNFVWKPEGKRPRHKLEDSNKMDLKEIG